MATRTGECNVSVLQAGKEMTTISAAETPLPYPFGYWTGTGFTSAKNGLQAARTKAF
jgi:hypothetical protein